MLLNNPQESQGASAGTAHPVPDPKRQRSKLNHIKCSQLKAECFQQHEPKGTTAKQGEVLSSRAVTVTSWHGERPAWLGDISSPQTEQGHSWGQLGLLPLYLSQAFLQHLHMDSEESSCEVIHLDGAVEKDRPDQPPIVKCM